MRLKYITKADIILAVVLLVLGLGSPFLLAKKDAKQSVQITMDGKVLGTYSLSEKTILVLSNQGLSEYSDTEYAALWDALSAYKANTKNVESFIYNNEEILNIIQLENGKANVVFATCHGNDCVKMGSIDSQGEVIACLPHKLLITIEAKGEDGPDVVL